MIYIGTLESVTDKELLISNASWIAETSRWNEFVKGASAKEEEPYRNDVIIGRGAILDATVRDGDFQPMVR